MLNRRLLPLSLVVAAGLAACAQTPPKNALLDQARSDYAAAQSNTEAVRLAPGEMNRAGDALNKANDAWSKRENSARVDQLAYVAKQQVAIAWETTKQKTAEADSANAGANREKMRLDARTTEADTAQRNAEASQRQSEASQRSAEASQRESAASLLLAQDADARSQRLEGQLKELDAKKTSRGLVITLGDVLFDSGQAQIKAGGMRGVQKLADVLKEFPQRNVLVEGFTDSAGASGYNQDLSDRRAMAVRTALLDSGISANRITNRGYGETFPVATNATASGRQLNRRVEIVVSEDGKTIAPR